MTTSEKTCFKCGTVKAISEFYKHSRMADGHLNKCKSCTKSDVNDHRAKNIERIREYDRQRGGLPHREQARREYEKTDACKQSRKASRQKYLQEKPDNRKETVRRYYENHKEKCLKRTSAYYLQNKSLMRPKKTAAQRARFAMQILRTPKWLTDKHKKAIKLKYMESQWMTAKTGIRHHVDHIVPIKGRTVSGLHVPWNLRVIPARENLKKGNR